MSLQKLSDLYAAGKLAKPDFINRMHELHEALFEYADYIKGTDVDSITIENGRLFLTVKESGIKMFLDRQDKRFIPVEMLNFHSIDPQERNLIARIMPNHATVFDIGANIGWYTLNFAAMPKVKRIYSFEPVPYTYSYLVKHLKLNRVRNATPFNMGFSDKCGKASFYWTKNETGSASVRNIQNRSSIDRITCKLSTVDRFMKGKRFPIDFIKCDVEGSELFVFMGAVETIKKCKPIIYTELLRKWAEKFGYHPNDVIKLLGGLGYFCFGFVGEKIKPIQQMGDDLQTTNFFFLHGEKHRMIIGALGRLAS